MAGGFLGVRSKLLYFRMESKDYFVECVAPRSLGRVLACVV